ncbi:MFS transporter [Mycoplasma suis]|nr:MFS transporter [Mycoplasma suis]
MTGDSSKSTGWAVTFPEISKGVASEAVNYSITIARGIFTIPASYILLKLGFRKACLMACGLVTVSLPLIFSPHWTVLILGRLVMAAGGTLTIIYISPLLSKLVLPEKRKKLAAWNGFTFALSGLLVNLLFMISPVSTFLTKHWQWTSSITALFSFIPLIVFYLNGKDFEIVSLKEKLTVSKPENYFTLLREKEAWMWILAYSCLLVVSVLFSSFVPGKLKDMISALGNGGTEKNSQTSSVVDWKSLFTVVFFSGTCFGLYFLGKLNLTQIQRTSIVKCSLNLMLVTWVFMAGAATLMHFFGGTSDYIFWLTNVIIFVGAFFLSFSGLGIQSVLLFIPLEYKNYSTQKTAIFFSCLWGIGYIILTGYYILASILASYTGPLSSLCFLTALITCFYLAACKLRESRPEYVDLTEYFRLRRNRSFATQASMNVQELREVKGLEEKSFKRLMYLLLLHNKTPIKYVGTTS